MMTKIVKLLYAFSLAVFIYLPFHALVSTMLVRVIGSKLPVKGIKDIAIVCALFPMLYIFIRFKDKASLLKKHKSYLFFLALFLLISLTVFGTYNQPPVQTLAGYIFNYRFYGFFIFCLGSSLLFSENIKNYKIDSVVKVVLLASFAVVFFGFLQVFILPKDFLSIFGYNETTIKPYQTIDSNDSFVRILSTLRGPNSLGAYLAMLAPLGIYFIKKIKTNKIVIVSIYLIFFIVTIYGSYSRSAWLGLPAGLAVYLFLTFKNKKIFAYTAGVILVTIVIGFMLRNSNFVQNVVFHRDPNEISEVNSDDQRLSSIKVAIERISDKPFGHGVGSSGPASNYGNNPYIIENYYLDIAYQVGWLGLLAYLGLIGSIGLALIRVKSDLAYAIFSGLVALSIIALFLPIWTDETISLTWWGLAGLIIGRNIVDKSNRR